MYFWTWNEDKKIEKSLIKWERYSHGFLQSESYRAKFVGSMMRSFTVATDWTIFWAITMFHLMFFTATNTSHILFAGISCMPKPLTPTGKIRKLYNVDLSKSHTAPDILKRYAEYSKNIRVILLSLLEYLWLFMEYSIVIVPEEIIQEYSLNIYIYFRTEY